MAQFQLTADIVHMYIGKHSVPSTIYGPELWKGNQQEEHKLACTVWRHAPVSYGSNACKEVDTHRMNRAHHHQLAPLIQAMFPGPARQISSQNSR